MYVNFPKSMFSWKVNHVLQILAAILDVRIVSKCTSCIDSTGVNYNGPRFSKSLPVILEERSRVRRAGEGSEIILHDIIVVVRLYFVDAAKAHPTLR